LLQEVTIREIERILAVTDALGIHREHVMIPLAPRRPGRVRRLPNGRYEIAVDAERPFDEWMAGLADAIRAAG
jgi:hypothetical protein